MSSQEKQQIITASLVLTGLFLVVLFLISNYSPLLTPNTETDISQMFEQLNEASSSGQSEASSSPSFNLDLNLNDLTSPE
jgi:hypothetical protein